MLRNAALVSTLVGEYSYSSCHPNINQTCFFDQLHYFELHGGSVTSYIVNFSLAGISTTLSTYMKNIDSGEHVPATVKNKKKAADYPIKSEVSVSTSVHVLLNLRNTSVSKKYCIKLTL